jgi:hypothetical protein
MQATKLSLTTWFQAFYLIGQAKTGISSLELSRHIALKISGGQESERMKTLMLPSTVS